MASSAFVWTPLYTSVCCCLILRWWSLKMLRICLVMVLLLDLGWKIMREALTGLYEKFTGVLGPTCCP